MTRTGRPSSYTPEMADAICAELADGKSLRSICSEEGVPDRVTVFRWLREREDFRSQYARAKQEGADALVDDMTAIADNESLDPNARRVRVDTRKWIASKLKPKVYGEKVALTDNDGGPLQITWAPPEGS